MSTTKASISKNISNELDISMDQSKKVLDCFLQTIIKHSKSRKIKISGFGSFYTHRTLKRLGRNPKTKESYIIKSRKKCAFKTSNKIKEILNWIKNYL